MEACYLRVNIPIIYFNYKNNFLVTRSSFSISQYFKYFLLTLSIINSSCGYGQLQQFRDFRFEFKLFLWKYFSIYRSIIFLKPISLYFVGLIGTFHIQGKESTMKSNFDNLLVLLFNLLKLNKSVKTKESEWLI